ncbi:hypothetical protein EMQ25_11730 [Arsenicitalea aurantiaca]|uniref:Uncharacterized protein n=1 Tax=Arsenicitalea aurantiaca TaxID=1783274 RepID=A0A433X7G3_9HYPH|nr:hypothetical protein [Arsenicitalea aurantiaca]RUT29999.1 hypothetical protein EMQ25_11730 [Arsenicitalea aurantiaca]
MTKFYFATLAAIIGLFLYSGTTGHFIDLPRLPFEVPFGRQVQPTDTVLDAPIVSPQMTGSMNITARQLVRRFERAGGHVRWERSRDERSWILHYSMPLELQGRTSTGAGRFRFHANASRAGIDGPGFQAVEWVEDGYAWTPAEIGFVLTQIAGTVRSERTLRR